MYDLAFFAGAIVGTYIVTAILWFAARNWPTTVGKAIFLNIVAMLIIVGWGSIGGADGGPPPVGTMFVIYGAAQIAVFLLDLLRVRRARTETT